jgi:hypothetical protein
MSEITTIVFAGTANGLPFSASWLFAYPLHPFEPDYSSFSNTNVLTDVTLTFDGSTFDFGAAGSILQGHQSGGTGTEIYGAVNGPNGANMSNLVITDSQFFNRPFNQPYIYSGLNLAGSGNDFQLCGSCSDNLMTINTVTLTHVPGPIAGEGVIGFVLCLALIGAYAWKQRRDTSTHRFAMTAG